MRTSVASILLLSVVGLSGCGEGFKVENGKVAYTQWNESSGKVTFYGDDADPKTFQTLDHDKHARAIYARDGRRVFVLVGLRPVTVAGADPASLRVLTNDGIYAKDKSHVYYWGVEIKGADPESFRILQAPFSRDSRRAFFMTAEIQVHKTDSFEVVQPGVLLTPWENAPPVVTSENRVKGSDKMIPSPNLASFLFGYSRDGIAYYLGAKEIEGADYGSFVILNERYAKDKDFVYYEGSRIAHADPRSFEVVGPTVVRGRDKNGEYWDGKRWNATK
jgi:hypothetical protein